MNHPADATRRTLLAAALAAAAVATPAAGKKRKRPRPPLAVALARATTFVPAFANGDPVFSVGFEMEGFDARTAPPSFVIETVPVSVPAADLAGLEDAAGRALAARLGIAPEDAGRVVVRIV